MVVLNAGIVLFLFVKVPCRSHGEVEVGREDAAIGGVAPGRELVG